MSATTTIPAELFLLLTNDAGRQDSTQFRKQALAAAAIAELLLRERVALSERRNPDVEIVDHSPTGEPALDQALAALAEVRRPRLQSVLSHRRMDLTEVIGEEFVTAGAVSRKDGWFTTTWPAEDSSIESALRARLVGSLRDSTRASLQDGIILELLRSLRIAHRILKDDLGGMKRREVDQAIKDLELDHPAAKALKQAMDSMNAAMAGAVGGAASAGS